MSKTKINLYAPHAGQKPIHKACNDKSTFFITAVAGRQSGKSAASINQALYWAMKVPDTLVYWVSPTSGQATKIYKQLLKMVLNTNLIKSYKGSQGDTEIIFENGSCIKFRSAAQEDSLRGETIDYLIIDEAAFIKESVFLEILLPMLNVKGKKCLIVSTPKGKNWLYYHYLKGQTDIKYKSFKFTSEDNPHSNPDIIAIAKKTMPKELFSQEYLADFIDAAAIFKNLKELCTGEMQESPKPNEKYFAGVDIGMVNDFTVVTFINQQGRVVYYERFNGDSPVIKDRLVNVFKKWKPRKIYFEMNNQGKPIYDDLKQIHKVKALHPWDTTAQSKPDIINNLINAFASKTINLFLDTIYLTELEAFTLSFSPTGKAKFSAPSGFHDDCVMSLAIAYECFNKHRHSGATTFTTF